MIITVEKVMAIPPCEDWTADRVRSYLGDGVSPAELADILLRITPEDAYWLLARLLPPQDRVEWACRCAERVLPVWEAAYPDDDRPRAAIEAARLGDTAANAASYVSHAANAAALAFDAATDAASAAHAAYAAANAAANAFDAAHAATRAAYAAARTAALAADDDHAADAAYAAAHAAETEWQIREACRMLEAVE